MKKPIIATPIALAWALFVTPAYAQDQGNQTEAEDDNRFGTIVVTARRQEENIDDTPLSVSAFGAEALEQRNTTDLIDVGKVIPNLTVNSFGNGNAAHAGVFVRGIGTQDHWITTDPGVGLYVDGVYLGRQLGANLDLLNIERVEVSRGPQGTLYGRNSLGGAVNFVTRKPSDEFEGKIVGRAGTRERFAGDIYLTGPLSDTFSASISGSYNRRGGVGKFIRAANQRSEVGESEKLSGRLALQFKPSDSFSLLFTADYADSTNGQAPYFIELLTNDPTRTLGLTAASLEADPDDSASLAEDIQQTSFETYGLSLTAEVELSDALTLKAIGSHRDMKYTGGLDLDSTVTFTFPEIGDSDQQSVELQLAGQFDNFGFVGGLYYFHENGSAFSDFDFGFPENRQLDTFQTTESYAAYLSANVRLADALTLSGGIRYTDDKKRANASVGLFFDPPGDPTRVFNQDSWGEVTWDASLLYEVSDGVNIYGQIARGYQNGGFPARTGFNPPAAFVPFDPQFATNYEVGLKGKVHDNVRLAASVFYTKYTDLQLVFNQAVNNGFLTITNNAGQSESYGAELDATILFSDKFSLTGSVGYLDAEVTQVDAGVIATQVGFAPIFSPKWTLAVTPEVRFPVSNGELVAAASYSYRSSMFGQSFNTAENRIEARGLFDLNISYTPDAGDWTFAFYGRNIFNKVYENAITDNSDAMGSTFNQVLLSNDRSEFGLKVTKTFGAW